MAQRRRIIPVARGRVLEIGIGSGLNLPFYDRSAVSHVWGLDPSSEMMAMAQERAMGLPFGVEFIQADGENLPLDDCIADCIVVTYTLCTIPNIMEALCEMRRVLKPDGRLVFCEHGASPERDVEAWQNRLNPLWRRLSGGCNLDRQVPVLLREAGFEILHMETGYISIPRILGFNYRGVAARG